jgi:hypothetical protein
MQALEFWKAVTVDQANAIEKFVGLLERRRLRYCVIDGQAVNAYVEPLVSLDLDVVIAAEPGHDLEALFATEFVVRRFPHSLNLTHENSALRMQIQTDPRYAPFVGRAAERDVLGLRLPVARIDDVLEGKVWAAADSTRRPSKRQKDLADIARILEAFPDLRDRVPDAILRRLE